MIVPDAINIMKLEGSFNEKSLKKRYRKLSFKYHPDKGGSRQMMQILNEAYETLVKHLKQVTGGKKSKIPFEAKEPDYGEKLHHVIKGLLKLGLIIEICGAWLWITGDTKPHRKKLGKDGLKCRWSPSPPKGKGKWYFRPEEFKSKKGRGKTSMDKIRKKYGSQTVVDDEDEKKLA